MEYPGIINHNEYFTNHYLCTFLEEEIKPTLNAWREESANLDSTNPVSLFRECGKEFAKEHNNNNFERMSLQTQRICKKWLTFTCMLLVILRLSLK